jgi:hypothetical protein
MTAASSADRSEQAITSQENIPVVCIFCCAQQIFQNQNLRLSIWCKYSGLRNGHWVGIRPVEEDHPAQCAQSHAQAVAAYNRSGSQARSSRAGHICRPLSAVRGPPRVVSSEWHCYLLPLHAWGAVGVMPAEVLIDEALL